MYIYIYIYTYIHLCRYFDSQTLNIWVCTHACLYTCVYTFMYFNSTKSFYSMLATCDVTRRFKQLDRRVVLTELFMAEP